MLLRTHRFVGTFFCVLYLTCGALCCHGAQPEKAIPVGIDAYRLWDEWPQQRIGMRAYMRSTYDRTGGNEGADASHFLFQAADDFNVTLDVQGAGVLMFSRFNHWHGSPWHFVVDGKDYVIEESSTRDPLHPDPQSTFLPSASFPPPLNETWAATKGADLIWSPIEFEKSFQMAYSRTRYGTGYYIYDQFVPGTRLTHPLVSWNPNTVPDQDVLDLLSRSGSDIAPQVGTVQHDGTIDIARDGITPVVTLKGRGAIRALRFSIPAAAAGAFEDARLRIYWDGRQKPSVDAPMALFFGAGTLFNRDHSQFLVKAFPVSIRFADGRIQLSCYFPMPFFKSARIEMVSAGRPVRGVEWSVRTLASREPANELAYFHATYRDHPHPVPGHDLVLLDTQSEEDSAVWSGSFIGTSLIFSHSGNLQTLEGDPRFFFDDSQTPQAQGTGTEEWGGGGDYWGHGMLMSLPFAGHPVGPRLPCESASASTDCAATAHPAASEDPDAQIESTYRFLLGDLMPFGRRAVIRLEHGGEDESREHYETVTYWYGLPSASLVETDHLAIGDRADELRHGYNSPDATAPYTIRSRYEWGVDTLHNQTIFPVETAQCRATKGTSEFQLRLRPDNVGVMLRRELDYSFADQRGEVFISDDAGSSWKDAGTWYLAGSNTVVYSNPEGELGKTEHQVETSDRRFRDDEFLIPKALTQGRKKIWVRIQFSPLNRPLYPGGPIGKQAWTEIAYTAYCFIQPKAPR
jgi:hypothetical protein